MIVAYLLWVKPLPICRELPTEAAHFFSTALRSRKLDSATCLPHIRRSRARSNATRDHGWTTTCRKIIASNICIYRKHKHSIHNGKFIYIGSGHVMSSIPWPHHVPSSKLKSDYTRCSLSKTCPNEFARTALWLNKPLLKIRETKD